MRPQPGGGFTFPVGILLVGGVFLQQRGGHIPQVFRAQCGGSTGQRPIQRGRQRLIQPVDGVPDDRDVAAPQTS
jgi:hypothetical protein